MPQLLRAHEVMEYVFDVSNVAYPVSIRDQMNRARWLVDKAYDLGFFGPVREEKYQRLLVCGAGAAGVTAALHAVGLGVTTVLVERSPAPFLRQRLCTSRWIDPTQYDWSADHWPTGAFPHAGPVMPLPWPADRSHRLGLRWHLRLAAALGNPLLTFRRPDQVVGAPVAVPTPPGSAGVQVRFASGGPPQDFGMMLWCVGFGDERRFALPNYDGFAFWETDPFERPDWGVASPPPDMTAMVSGAGDGALQDVIRLATLKKSARDVYDALTTAGWRMPADERHRLFAAEDQAQRALLWCRPRSAEEHRALDELHREYVAVVKRLVTADPGHATLVAAVTAALRANPGRVLMTHPCTHFARTYGLNHFLVLLLAEVASAAGLVGGPEIRPNLGVKKVDGVPWGGHACANNPWACHGLAHLIDLEGRPSCHGPAGPAAGTVTAHVVVIRHGIAPHPAVVGTPMAFARQVMPYHLP